VVKPLLFGKFCLLERVSVGGMAEVFRAKAMDAPGFDKFLAIKRILPNLAEDDEFIDMFIDEAKLAVQLTHRNICQIYELGRMNDSHYIVMEFISGRDVLAIQNRLRKERRIMAVGQAAYLCRQIAAGLDYAHKKADAQGRPMGIIHRDISPQNVLVSYTGEVKVIDFGIAKAATRDNKTQVGVLKGKFGYMSPEQVRGMPIDRRSDIFALGTLFHELLTCRRLFHGESDFATLEKVRKADVPAPSKLNPNVPPEVDRIVERSLTVDPNQRYQWCSDMIDDLDNFLSKLRPPYTERTLEEWMQRMFEEEISKEREKRQIFVQFQTPQDVDRYNDQLQRELSAKLGLPEAFDGKDKDEMSSQSTQIWDAAKGLPGADMALTEEATVQDGGGQARTMIVDVADVEGNVRQERKELPPRPVAKPQAASPVAYVPPSMAHLYQGGDAGIPLKAPAPSPWGKIGLVLVVLLLFGTLLAVGGVGYVFLTRDKAAVVTLGSIVVNTEPVQDVEVLLDGKIAATKTPHTLEQLAPGSYTLEVRHNDYLPNAKKVEVTAGVQQNVSLTLKPKPVGEGELTLRLEPVEAELYVDGVLKEGSEKERVLSLDDKRVHLIEARLEGYFVTETRLEMTDGQKVTKTLKLRPLEGSLDLNSNPQKAAIYLDGTKVGVTPMKLPKLDPRQAHEVMLRYPGYEPWKKLVVFDKSHQKTFSVTLDKEPPDEGSAEKFGYVTAVGKDWWKVLIDGWDSGLTTPLTGKGRLTLPAGEHTISLVRGDTRHDHKVVVEDEKTVEIAQEQPFSW
jgi:serine/threonine protein kinase